MHETSIVYQLSENIYLQIYLAFLKAWKLSFQWVFTRWLLISHVYVFPVFLSQARVIRLFMVTSCSDSRHKQISRDGSSQVDVGCSFLKIFTFL